MDTKDNYSNRIEHTVYTFAPSALVILAGERKWANCATGFLWCTWLFCTFSRGGLLAQAAQKLPTRYGAPAAKLSISSRVVGTGKPRSNTLTIMIVCQICDEGSRLRWHVPSNGQDCGRALMIRRDATLRSLTSTYFTANACASLISVYTRNLNSAVC